MHHLAPYTRTMQSSIEGEVIGASRSERFHAAERRIERVTHALDELVGVPGTSVKVGLDPIVGLIPVVGDVISGVVGTWVIAEAARFGIPRIVVARMTVNLVVDLAIGLIPFLGDLFDLAFRSNSRNLALFRRHALEPDASTRGEATFFVGVALLLIGVLWLIVTAIGAVWQVLQTEL
ncbi:MAG: conserved rane protein of unknown function [Chloroflexota bacterium]|nr:conserved rane protein of unknown function [Chloroflexota bacterium]